MKTKKIKKQLSRKYLDSSLAFDILFPKKINDEDKEVLKTLREFNFN